MMKKGLWMIGTFLLCAVLIGVAYIRLVPLDAGTWHVPIEASADKDQTGGAVRVIAGDTDTLRALDRAARGLARTNVLAGSVDDGRITYVTRSMIFGFPDLTTIELRDGHIRLFARLRFGQSDFGVNRKRLERLIAAVEG